MAPRAIPASSIVAMDVSPLPRGNTIKDHREGERPKESGQWQGIIAEQGDERRQKCAAKDDHADSAETRTSRYADDAGIGQWIAEQTLHDRAGDGERSTDQRAQDDTRQADVINDDPVAQ